MLQMYDSLFLEPTFDWSDLSWSHASVYMWNITNFHSAGVNCPFFFLLVTNILLKRGLTRDNPIRKILEQWHKRIISPKSEMYCWIRFMKYIVMFPIHDRPDGVCFSFLSEIWVSSYTDGDTWQWVSSHIWLGSQNMSASL